MKSSNSSSATSTSSIVSGQQEINTIYQVNGFVVAGYITEVCFTKKGVPYYGGPRYKVTWENGQVDEEISAKDLLEMYRQTPRSLGCCTVLDDAMSRTLLAIGRAIGVIIENQKLKYFLSELRDSINRKHLSYHGLTEIALEAVTSMMAKIRDISLVGYNKSTSSFRALVEYFPAKTVKAGLTFDLSVFDVAEKLLDSKFSSDPAVFNDKHRTDWVVVELQMAEGFYWSSFGDFQRYFIVINRDKASIGGTTTLELSMLSSVSMEISQAVKVIWLNSQRKKGRASLLRSIVQKLFDWNSLPLEKLCFNAIDFIKNELHGANMYIGLLEIGGKTINFCSASFRSQMEGNTLKRGEGISFGVIDSLITFILKPGDVDKTKFLKEDAVVDVMYGRKRFRSKILRVRGHEKYDVRYDVDRKTEAGVDISRIIPIDAAFEVKVFAKSTFPYLCIPLRTKNKALGVVGVDGIGKIPTSPWVTHPDPDLVTFLESFANIVASHIDTHRKKLSIKNLNAIAKNANIAVGDIVDSVIECIYNNLLFTVGVCFAEYAPTVLNPQIKSTVFLNRRGSLTPELFSRMKRFNVEKSSQKAVQYVGDNDVFLLFKLQSSPDTDGKLFMLGISHEVLISEPDRNFLISLHKIILAALENTVSHKVGTQLKYESLRGIRSLCNVWREIASSSMSTAASRAEFFTQFVHNIHICFHNVNVYVGTLGMYSNVITYSLASSQSEMSGKVLKRSADTYFISFEAMDSMQTLVVVNKSDPKAASLYHFGPRQALEYPFVAVPLVSHIDCVIGIMGVDGCDDLASDSSTSIEDLISFFRAAGLYLANVIRYFKADDARLKLKRISARSSSYTEGLLEVKRLLLDYAPNAKRVLEVSIEPRDFIGNEEDIINEVEEFCVLVYISHLAIVSNHAKCQHIECSYNDRIVMRSKIGKTIALKPFTFSMKVTNAADHVLRIRLLDAQQKESCRANFGQQYFLHTPQVPVDILFDNAFVKDVRVATCRMVTKAMSPNQIAGLSLERLSVELNTESVKVGNLSTLFCSVKWNNSEMHKTTPIAVVPVSEFSNLKIYLKLFKAELSSNELEVYLWGRNARGKSDVIGSALVTASTLIESTSGSKATVVIPFTRKILTKEECVGLLTIHCSPVRAESLNEAQLMEEVSVGSTTTSENVDDIPIAERKYYSSELSVLCARELIPSIDSSGKSANSYVSVLFNGVELGKTGIIYDSCNPVWSEEYFTIRIPADDEIETSCLLLDVYHFIEEGEHADNGNGAESTDDVLIGRVEIFGSSILNLLASHTIKKKWYDLTESVEIGSSIVKIGKGQIKLSGRPLELTGAAEDDPPDDAMALVGLISIHNLDIFDYFDSKEDEEEVLTYATIKFNGRKIFELSPAVTKEVITRYDENTVLFRLPKSTALEKSVLRFEVWQSCRLWRHPFLAGTVVLTGKSLESFLRSDGIVTRRLMLLIEDGVRDSMKSNDRKPFILVNGGPAATSETLEESSRELWLEVSAATNLPFTLDADGIRRVNPSPYCIIFWNGRRVGCTQTLQNMRNPRWEKQLFILKLPIHHDTSITALTVCRLRIEIYSSAMERTVLLGSLEIAGPPLLSMFIFGKATVDWFEVKLNDENATKNGRSQLKLFGLWPDPDKDPVIENRLSDKDEEYTLEIISARDLRNVDAYGNTCPYATVDWCGEEIGRTNVVVNSVKPSFQDEQFFLKTSSSREYFYTASLVIQFWSFKKSPNAPIFLGYVAFDGSRLRNLLNDSVASNQQVECPLLKSADFTAEENSLVGGYCKFRCSKLLDSVHVRAAKEYYFSIVDISMFESSTPFDLFLSDIHVKVFETNSFGTNTACEIHKTDGIKRSQEPAPFEEEFVTVKVNIFEKALEGIKISMEVWDSIGDLSGCVSVEGAELVQLLTNSTGKPVPFTIKSPSNGSKQVGSISLMSLTEMPLVRKKTKEVLLDVSTLSMRQMSSKQSSRISLSAHGQRSARPFTPASEGSSSARSNEDALVLQQFASAELNAESRPVSPELPDMTLSIKICEAKGLAKVNTFKGGSDVFVELAWSCDVPIDDANYGSKVVGKSQIIPNTLEPVFGSSGIFTVKKPKGVQFESCSLKICLFAKSSFKDIFLGECFLNGHELLQLIVSGTVQECVLKAGQKDRTSNYVQGMVRMSCRRITDIETSPIFNLHLPLPKDIREFEIDVISVMGLPPVMTAEDKSVYCIVRWGPIEVGKTSFVKTRGNVIYFDENQSLVIRVPYPFKSSADHLSDGAGRSNGLSINYSDIKLEIDVYEVTSGKTGDIGPIFQARLDDKEIEAFISSRFHQHSYELESVDDSNSLSNSTAKVRLLFTRRYRPIARISSPGSDSGGENQQSQKEYNIQLLSAKIDLDLFKAPELPPVLSKESSLFSISRTSGQSQSVVLDRGKTNPQIRSIGFFFRVRLNGKFIGRSLVVKDTDPLSWEGENFCISLPEKLQWHNCELQFEVFRWNSQGDEDFIGTTTIAKASLLNAIPEDGYWKTNNYQITYNPEGLQTQHSASESNIEILFSEKRKPAALWSSRPSLELIVHGAKDIKVLDLNSRSSVHRPSVNILGAFSQGMQLMARSDVLYLFAIVKWKRQEIDRTIVVKNTAEFVWNKKSDVALDKDDSIDSDVLEIDVWTHVDDYFKGQYLGSVSFTAANLLLLEQSAEKQLFDLKKVRFLDTDSAVTLKSGKLEISCKRKEVDLSKIRPKFDLTDCLMLRWSTVPDLLPNIELSILSVHNLPPIAQPNSYSPFCRVVWKGQEVGMTPKTTYTGEHLTRLSSLLPPFHHCLL